MNGKHVFLAAFLFTSTAHAVDAPQNLSVSIDAGSGSADLSWSEVDGATGYNIYRDDMYIDTVLEPETSYTDVDADADSAYYLIAFDNNVSPTEFSPRSNNARGMVSFSGCNALPSHAALTHALRASIQPTGGPGNGGFNLNMWATVVNRDGVVCAVARSGDDRGDQWPGSRVISAQKANTANAFSLPGLALSTANLWAATQPGGSLFGLQFSNPVDPAVAYADSTHNPGTAAAYGTSGDPMVGNFIGGINVFGGGLALYDAQGTLVGGIGVSGDTSCADHNIAWRTRAELELDYVPGGVGNAERPDNINYQGLGDNSALQNDFSHPICAIAGVDSVSSISLNALPPVRTQP